MRNAERYEQDFYLWTQQQAALLREGKWQDLDYTNLAEEIESVGRSDKRELSNRLKVLVLHLLKWQYQPAGREQGHSWRRTSGFGNSAAKLRQSWTTVRVCSVRCPGVSPSSILRHDGKRYAIRGCLRGLFRPMCPWTPAQILDEEFGQRCQYSLRYAYPSARPMPPRPASSPPRLDWPPGRLRCAALRIPGIGSWKHWKSVIGSMIGFYAGWCELRLWCTIILRQQPWQVSAFWRR